MFSGIALPVGLIERHDLHVAGDGRGGRAPFDAEPVVIPATRGLDLGVWFAIEKGVRGLAVRDEQGRAVVFPVCEPASHYYAVLMRSDWMPVLVGERI
jgi:hypothetical protein